MASDPTRRRRVLHYDPRLEIFEYETPRGVWKTVTIGGGGSGVADADYGDITVSGVGTSWTIDNQAVHLGGIVHASAASLLLGRQSGSAGAWQEITLGSGLTMTGSVLEASAGGGGLSQAQVLSRASLRA